MKIPNKKKSRQAKNENDIIQQSAVQQKSRRRAINEDDITMDDIITRKRSATLGASETSTIAKAKARAEMLGQIYRRTELNTTGYDADAEAEAKKALRAAKAAFVAEERAKLAAIKAAEKAELKALHVALKKRGKTRSTSKTTRSTSRVETKSRSNTK